MVKEMSMGLSLTIFVFPLWMCVTSVCSLLPVRLRLFPYIMTEGHVRSAS